MCKACNFDDGIGVAPRLVAVVNSLSHALTRPGDLMGKLSIRVEQFLSLGSTIESNGHALHIEAQKDGMPRLSTLGQR